MECRRVQHEQCLELIITGRLDAQWADGLERELSELLRDGVRHIRLEMSGIVFLSSAGIRILIRYRKELAAVDGCLIVISPSDAVFSILKMTGLLALLETPQSLGSGRTEPAPSCPAGKRVHLDGVGINLYRYDPQASMKISTIGVPQQELDGGYSAAYRLELPADMIALGLGAFGEGFDDCKARFGEFMALGGSALTLPADGAETPDFMVGVAEFVPSVQALYAIVCQGEYAAFGQFNSDSAGEPVKFSKLLAGAFEICKSDCISLAMIAETSGLVGASLLASPALSCKGQLLEFPSIRDRIALTSEPVWPHSLALVCGIALRNEEPKLSSFVRPLGLESCRGHFHATALSYRTLPDGLLELAPTVSSLMETQNLQGLLHMINDSRPITGIGESCFLRGALWCGPATMQEGAP